MIPPFRIADSPNLLLLSNILHELAQVQMTTMVGTSHDVADGRGTAQTRPSSRRDFGRTTRRRTKFSQRESILRTKARRANEAEPNVLTHSLASASGFYSQSQARRRNFIPPNRGRVAQRRVAFRAETTYGVSCKSCGASGK